jgi:sulfonate transport system permease protein
MADATPSQALEVAFPEQTSKTSNSARGSATAAAPAGSARTRSRRRAGTRRRLASLSRRAAAPIALIVLWQLASTFGWIDSKTLASPLQVWHTAKELSNDGELWPNVLVSLRRVVIGLAIGGAIGTAFGLVAGLSKIGEELVDAPLQMLRTLPFLGLLPLLVVWLGIGEGIKIGLVVIGVIFPIYLNLHKGIRNVDPRFAELSRSCEVGRWGMVRKVILPGAMPSYLVGLRFALGIAWLSLVVGETTNAEKGIGYLMMQGEEYLRTEVIVLGLVIYAILGLCMEGIVRLIEWKALPWHKEFVS